MLTLIGWFILKNWGLPGKYNTYCSGTSAPCNFGKKGYCVSEQERLQHGMFAFKWRLRDPLGCKFHLLSNAKPCDKGEWEIHRWSQKEKPVTKLAFPCLILLHFLKVWKKSTAWETPINRKRKLSWIYQTKILCFLLHFVLYIDQLNISKSCL